MDASIDRPATAALLHRRQFVIGPAAVLPDGDWTFEPIAGASSCRGPGIFPSRAAPAPTGRSWALSPPKAAKG